MQTGRIQGKYWSGDVHEPFIPSREVAFLNQQSRVDCKGCCVSTQESANETVEALTPSEEQLFALLDLGLLRNLPTRLPLLGQAALTT